MKTTKSHFGYFKKCCDKWVKIFGLLDWEIDYDHKKSEGALINSEAWCTYDQEGGQRVTVGLSTEWDSPVNKNTLYLAARHEILHLLLAHLSMLTEQRFGITPEGINQAEHIIIRRLESVLE
jgi:hypothetical protein